MFFEKFFASLVSKFWAGHVVSVSIYTFSNFLMRLEYNDLYCARSPKWKTTSVKHLQNIVGSRSKIWKVLEFPAVDSGQLFHDVLSWSRENNRKIKNHFSPKDVSYNWTKSHRVSVVSADYSSSNRWKAGGWAEKYFGIILVTVCDRWTLSGRSLSYYFFVSNKDCPSFVTLKSGKVWLLG